MVAMRERCGNDCYELERSKIVNYRNEWTTQKGRRGRNEGNLCSQGRDVESGEWDILGEVVTRLVVLISEELQSQERQINILGPAARKPLLLIGITRHLPG